VANFRLGQEFIEPYLPEETQLKKAQFEEAQSAIEGTKSFLKTSAQYEALANISTDQLARIAVQAAKAREPDLTKQRSLALQMLKDAKARRAKLQDELPSIIEKAAKTGGYVFPSNVALEEQGRAGNQRRGLATRAGYQYTPEQTRLEAVQKGVVPSKEIGAYLRGQPVSTEVQKDYEERLTRVRTEAPEDSDHGLAYKTAAVITKPIFGEFGTGVAGSVARERAVEGKSPLPSLGEFAISGLSRAARGPFALIPTPGELKHLGAGVQKFLGTKGAPDLSEELNKVYAKYAGPALKKAEEEQALGLIKDEEALEDRVADLASEALSKDYDFINALALKNPNLAEFIAEMGIDPRNAVGGGALKAVLKPAVRALAILPLIGLFPPLSRRKAHLVFTHNAKYRS